VGYNVVANNMGLSPSV